MRILVTNDDGINAPGLVVLESIARDIAGEELEQLFSILDRVEAATIRTDFAEDVRTP